MDTFKKFLLALAALGCIYYFPEQVVKTGHWLGSKIIRMSKEAVR